MLPIEYPYRPKATMMWLCLAVFGIGLPFFVLALFKGYAINLHGLYVEPRIAIYIHAVLAAFMGTGLLFSIDGLYSAYARKDKILLSFKTLSIPRKKKNLEIPLTVIENISELKVKRQEFLTIRYDGGRRMSLDASLFADQFTYEQFRGSLKRHLFDARQKSRRIAS